MADRRSSPRFVLRTPLGGRLRFAHEVVIEHYDGEELAVLSTEAAGQNEILQFDDVSLGPPLSIAVRVEESRPALVGGDLLHRVRLRPAGKDSVLQRPDLRASLAREIPALLTQVCRTGCLLEVAAPVQPETIAELLLAIDGRMSSGVVQIRRCQFVPGRGQSFRVAAQFLSRGRRGNSLPLAVDRLTDEEEWRSSDPSRPQR